MMLAKKLSKILFAVTMPVLLSGCARFADWRAVRAERGAIEVILDKAEWISNTVMIGGTARLFRDVDYVYDAMYMEKWIGSQPPMVSGAGGKMAIKWLDGNDDKGPKRAGMYRFQLTVDSATLPARKSLGEFIPSRAPQNRYVIFRVYKQVKDTRWLLMIQEHRISVD